MISLATASIPSASYLFGSLWYSTNAPVPSVLMQNITYLISSGMLNILSCRLTTLSGLLFSVSSILISPLIVFEEDYPIGETVAQCLQHAPELFTRQSGNV